MKLKKKSAVLISFILGGTLFVSTAVADVISKSGYEQLKDSLKATGSACSDQLKNFTVDGTMVMKNGNDIIVSADGGTKYDNVNLKTETFNKEAKPNGDTSMYYNYSDKNEEIYTTGNNRYTVNKYKKGDNIIRKFQNPFAEEKEKDLEKIADALVGNLKDYIVVSENEDGSKEYSSSLNESQIPTLVNAVTSFMYKQNVNNGRFANNSDDKKFPKLSEDVFIKEGNLKVHVNKDGIADNIFITGTLSGKDKEGKVQNISLEVLFKITDINSTIVKEPDLTGKKVIEQDSNNNGETNRISKKYIGEYKNNIVLQKDDKFIKIGERILDITKADESGVEGVLHQNYFKGYENYDDGVNEIKINATVDKNSPNLANFTYTNSEGKSYKGNIYFEELGNAGLYCEGYNDYNTEGFERVFDK